MVTGTTLISVQDYLSSSYKPLCEYIDGVLRSKSMPTYKHGKMELRVSTLINELDRGFEAVPEQTVKIREAKYLVPDVVVQRFSELQQPYPAKPVYLCIEVLSPDDRFSEAVAKCEEYHAWAVRFCWMIDPKKKQCWEYEAGHRPRQAAAEAQLTTPEIAIGVEALFAGF